MREFGCSRDTASRDIAKLIASNPDLLVYDASQKVHRATAPAGKKAA
jgi:predicted DNA-binding transcriptional regulator YafY